VSDMFSVLVKTKRNGEFSNVCLSQLVLWFTYFCLEFPCFL